MPIWWVSEPALTLWLKDSPMTYQPSHGQPITFQLFFDSIPNQASINEQQSAPVFSVGANWSTPWLSYLLTSGDNDYTWINGSGGFPDYQATNHAGSYYWSSVNYRDHTWLGVTNGIATLNYPSGA